MKDNSLQRGPIYWMAGHSVTANIIMVILLVGGIFLSLNIKKEVFPDFDLDRVVVTVAYDGASPEEVERGIILAVEEAVQDLEGIKEVTSTADEGVGTVVIEILEGENIHRIFQDIKGEVDRITSFPEEAEEPQVVIAQRKRSVISLALYGDFSDTVLHAMGEEVRDRLLQDNEITQVELSGVRDLEISIEIPQDKLRAYGLTLSEVALIIRQAAIELPGGAIKTKGGDILVRIKERREYGAEFGKIPVITTNSGTQVLLEDLAVIEDGFEETDEFATYNGKPAVQIEVFRVGDQTPIEVSSAVKRKIEEIKKILPPGMGLDARNDRSEIYRQRMDLMMKNGIMGLCLVFCLLALFLEPRLAFWVSLGIPISIFGSLLFLPAMDVSINVISMFAFIVTLGIVVDDAIVAGENMFHHQQTGQPWFQAAVNGTREIAMPVFFSVATNMIAFIPMFFVPGFMGKIFKQIPIVVISVFTVSLIESLFILPAHIGHQRRQSPAGFLGWIYERQRRFSDLFTRFVHQKYGPVLQWCLDNRYINICIGVAILVVTISYIRSGRMGFELFPKVESDYAKVEAVLPFGSAVEQTRAVQQTLVAAAQHVADKHGGKQLVEGVYALVRNNQTEVYVYLTPPGKRPISTAVFTEDWRNQVGRLAGLEYIKFESDAGGPGRGSVISVELSHRDLGVLEKASEEIADALGFFPNVMDIDDGFSPGKQQIDIQIRPEARSLGMQAQDVARQIRYSFYGAVALRQQRGRNEITIRVRLPKEERISEQNLEEMILRSPSGKEIPLTEAVTMQRGRAYTKIDRRDGRRIITVTADAMPRSKAGEVTQALQADILPKLQRKYPGLIYSFEGRQADQRESMQSLIQGLLIALLVIFGMLAIPFNSFIQPMIILIAVPFGIVGAVIGHLVMGFSLSIMSMFGIVALSGVVINDSLVLIDFSNRKAQGGESSPKEAVHSAGLQRFRPVLLTTVTTFGGLAPMIFETSRQARFLIPMAVSLGFGILFGTMITLMLVPSLYLVVEDIKNLFRQ